MWFHEDEDDDEGEAVEKSRPEEEFPESYGKYMEAKKGKCLHSAQCVCARVCVQPHNMWNGMFTLCISISLQLKRVTTKRTSQSRPQLAALSLPSLILQGLPTVPTASQLPRTPPQPVPTAPQQSRTRHPAPW